MSSLIEISRSLDMFFEVIEGFEDDGVSVPEEFQDELSKLLTEQADKVDRCAMYVNYARTNIDFLKREKEILDKQIKRIESRVERMKDVARFLMEKQGVKVLAGLKGHSFTARVTKSVEVSKEAHELPHKFVKVTTTYAPDKIALKEALLNKEVIDGVSIKESISISVK